MNLIAALSPAAAQRSTTNQESVGSRSVRVPRPALDANLLDLIRALSGDTITMLAHARRTACRDPYIP